MPLILLAAVVLAAAEPAAADTAAAAPAPVSAVTVKPKPKSDKVCWDEKPTGSHMPTHVCVTKAEWDERQRQDQKAISDTRRVGAKGSFGPQ